MVSNRTIITIAIIGMSMILLGVVIMFLQGLKEDICNNTSDFKWYYENCMEKK